MDLAGPEQAGACGWALNEGFKSGTISKREVDIQERSFNNITNDHSHAEKYESIASSIWHRQ